MVKDKKAYSKIHRLTPFETNVLSKQMQKGILINRISILDILLSGQDNCTCGAPSYLWVIERLR